MTAAGFLLDLILQFRFQILILLLSTVAWKQWASYRRLAQFKGPFWAQFTSLWMSEAVATKRNYLELYEVSQKYGELARIGPNVLLTSDPDLLHKMSAARSRYTKSRWYAGQRLEADRDNLFSTIDETMHAKRRAQLAPGFTGREIDRLEAVVDKHVLELTDLIKRKYISTSLDLRPLDVARKASFFTMDVITDIAFGQTWGCLSKDEDVGKWFQSFELIMPNAIRASTIPWVASLFNLPIIGKLVMPSDKDAIGAGRLLGILKVVVEKRFEREDPGEARDMMGSAIRNGLTKSEAVSEATLQIVAGGDTTATAIRSTMLFIITNPHVYRVLQAEIDSIKPTESVIRDDEAKKLPYLQAVIKEGSRIWPVATGLMSKVAPAEGDTINGRFIPGGTEIGQCVWAIQRSKAIYGEDSMLFRPERWLEATGEKLESMERVLGLAWGYGKYSCLGKNLALIELNKVLFELLRKFDFTLIDPSQPWTSHNFGLWMQRDMFVKVTERTK